MGHQHLLRLPKTKAWNAVVALIAGGADITSIASATSKAAERSMVDAGEDDLVRQSFFLLTQIPLAARYDDFGSELRQLGLSVGDEPTLVEIGTAMMEAIDDYASRRGARTDYGEIAQLAAVESIQAVAGREVSDLFNANAIRVHNALRELADPRRFAVLARDFFSRLTRRHLNFYLSRELASHIGPGHRFPGLFDHEEFEEALELHCREASRIIKEFACDWFYKHVSQRDLDRDIAGRFVHVAAGKIREELERRQPLHA